jgi:hypothetical protein
MAGLKRDNLHFSLLTVQALIQQLPSIPSAPLLPGQVPLVPLSLSTDAIARIFAAIASLGIGSMQQIAGGAQLASQDGVTAVIVTANALQFTEDLTRSNMESAHHKLGSAADALFRELAPRSVLLQQTVDLQGVWDSLGRPADEFVAASFLNPSASKVVDDIGFTFAGAGIRLSVFRPIMGTLPPGVSMLGGEAPRDAIDVRIEPLFVDRSRLFLEVTGTFAPTEDFKEIVKRSKLVHDVAWDKIARNLELGSKE